MRSTSSASGTPEDDGPRLTIRAAAAAARLGVAVPTLRSWERRYGIGPEPRAPGAHRRYSAADMARLEYFCRLVGEGSATADAARAALARTELTRREAAAPGDAEPVETDPSPSPGRARGVARCAMRLDQSGTLEILEQTLSRDGVIAAWETTIEPALLAVGRKWTESQGHYVEVEHLLSWCVTVALHRVRAATPPKPAARRVLLACSPDEWHSLPLEVLAAALRERGVAVSMLGAAVPAEALNDAVGRIDPACVVVWSQTQSTAEPARLPVPGEGSHCRVRAAGPGWLSARPPLAGVLLSPADALDACLCGADNA
ncbi:MerR family transcriptional regulator [Actinospica robiniae]|uniref:MerR family transcriptional regulator n=1 Tax=Actinospica robiniae TaxID=304901 RepID=UPI0004101786|nr:MerR family transcriptional regulator [Actinospica robiniae]